MLKEHDNTIELPLDAVTMTKGDDGCLTGMDTLDLKAAINDGGVFVGFMPSDTGYRLKVTLKCSGTCSVEEL